MGDVATNLAVLTDRIRDAASRASRNVNDIEVMAVTKTHPREAVLEAYSAGLRLFGENRVGEAVDKYNPVPEGSRLHLIGHLQRNKARDAALLFHAFESIDKRSTVEAILRHAPLDRKPVSILIEVNTSGESTKYGVHDREALRRLVGEIRGIDDIVIDGLMTIAPFTDDERAVRSAFASLREHLEAIQGEFDLPDAHTLSMGMSGDFGWAIAEGATRIRVGTVLFGARDS